MRGDVQGSKHTQNFAIVYYLSSKIQFHIWAVGSIFNFFYYKYFPSGILSMVFPSPLIQLSANSSAIWEPHNLLPQRPILLVHLHPLHSETCTSHDFWWVPLCCFFLTIHIFSVTFSSFPSSTPYLELCLINRKCLFKKGKSK